MTETRISRAATIRHRGGITAAAVAWIAVAWAAIVGLTGGAVLRVSGHVVSARDPLRPLMIAAVCFVAARLLLGSGGFAGATRIVVGERREWARRLAIAVSSAVFVFAVGWNTHAAGGSDSSCYVLQADAFANGRAALDAPLSRELPSLPAEAYAPTGFIPSPQQPPSAVPICGAGLALLMTPWRIAGGRGAVFLVVPLCAGLLVWLTFAFGAALNGPLTGAIAAILLACSPVFLYQAVQPMSDVPAAAFTMATIVLLTGGGWRRAAAAGFCASVAVLIRPNLAAAVLPLLLLLRTRREWVAFAASVLPGTLFLALLNAVRYGSPFATGYGDTGVLFSAANVGPNLARYSRWIIETETPIVVLALGAPLVFLRSDGRRLVHAAFLSMGAIVLTYVFYGVFDDWWYLRFLLPALPIALALSVCVVLRLVQRDSAAHAAGAVLITCALGAWLLHAAGRRHVLEIQALESRFVLAGRYAAETPQTTVFLAVQQSGSIRYHGGRETLAWDGIPADRLDATIAALHGRGHAVLFALEDVELARFRARFAGQHAGALDWPPRAIIHAPVRVSVYDPSPR